MATADEEFVRQLREVFDLCDELKCGFISVDQLKEIVRNHLGNSDEEIAQLIECLDPDRHGVVTFPDFCRGAVAAVHNKGNAPSLEDSSKRSKPKFVIGSPSESVPTTGTRREEFSPPSHPGCEDDSAIATGSDVSRESFREDKQDSPSDGEESYVCVGHLSKPSDLNSCGSFRSNSSAGSNGGGGGNNRRRRSLRMFHRSGSKRLSSAAISSQLLRSSSRNASRRNSESSDELFPAGPMSLENDVNDLNQKVEELQQQVANLTDHQVNTDERYTKVKQENAVLQTKIHCLEEQLKELELRSDDRLKEEQKQFREIMARHERESKHEIEQYANRFLTLQQEYMQLSEEKIRAQAQLEKLKQEKESIEDKLLETQSELASFREEHQRLQEVIRHERAEFASEIANSNKLVEELTKELDSVRQSKLDQRARSPSLLELPAQYRELERELRKVKDENKQILETNEELHAQLLSTSLQEGRSLLYQHGVSLADEFENLTKDEITNALREQKEVNAKLRAYIDGILLNILENHPQLLEVKTNL